MTTVWIIAWLLTTAGAALLRNRFYALFLFVLLGVQVFVWSMLFADASPLSYAAWGLSAAVHLHYLFLVRAKMRPLWYRILISWPALFFVAGSLLSIPGAIAAALGVNPVGWWIPWPLAAIGFVQSLTHRPSTVDLVLDGTHAEALGRHARGVGRDERPLRVAHITDTHLGPFVSVDRLRNALERVAADEPDLVLLTGDYMTMESNGDADVLRSAFAPLAALQGRVYASHGNHDLEAPRVLADAFEELGIQLLVDQEATVETEVGAVQLIGIDYKFRGASDHVQRISESFPRRDAHLRIVLLHHPGHFQHVPDGLGDLVLAGHTHGGQLGLVDLGLNLTMMRVAMSSPDHGFWGLGRNRLYVNRGLGHYGFPLRIGVSAEEPTLRIHRHEHESDRN